MEEEALEDEEKDPVAQPPPSDDTRVENMDISDEGSGLASREQGGSVGQEGSVCEQVSYVLPSEDGGALPSGSPEVLEEDEAELELQKQLEKGRRLRQLQQLQQLRDSGEKVRLGMEVDVWFETLRACEPVSSGNTHIPSGIPCV